MGCGVGREADAAFCLCCNKIVIKCNIFGCLWDRNLEKTKDI